MSSERSRSLLSISRVHVRAQLATDLGNFWLGLLMDECDSLSTDASAVLVPANTKTASFLLAQTHASDVAFIPSVLLFVLVCFPFPSPALFIITSSQLEVSPQYS